MILSDVFLGMLIGAVTGVFYLLFKKSLEESRVRKRKLWKWFNTLSEKQKTEFMLNAEPFWRQQLKTFEDWGKEK